MLMYVGLFKSIQVCSMITVSRCLNYEHKMGFAECDKCFNSFGVRGICKTSLNEREADEAAMVPGYLAFW